MNITVAAVKGSGLTRAMLAKGVITQDQLETTISADSEASSVAAALINSGLISSESLAYLVSGHYGFPMIDIQNFDPSSLDNLESDILAASKGLEVVILGKRHDVLYVGMADPTDLAVIQQLKFRTQLQIEPIVAEQAKIADILVNSNSSNEVDDRLLAQAAEAMEEQLGDSAGDSAIDDAPIVRFVQKQLTEAIRKGASDIHFEPYEKSYRIRFRIDGVLIEQAAPPLGTKNAIAARVKIMSSLNTTETRVPQDGRIRLVLGDDKKIDFRVSTLPTLFGEKIVMRILNSNASMMKLEQLGYNETQTEAIHRALAMPHGMLLVTGPTGSGKTVSLYAFLNLLNDPAVNISTVEDPSEINFHGINQVNINDKVGLTFAKALKALLRQDPDVIMVGEIRDLETADISIKASQTGHKVLSTLHTNDAVATIVRLKNMGVEPFNIASSVNLIIAQRLVRRLCSCKTPEPRGIKALADSGLLTEVPQEDWTPFKAVGCDRCNGSGYKGRTGIYEVLPISEAMQELILRGATALEMDKQARAEGVLTMQQCGIEKIKEGITSIEEILGATKAE